MEASVFEIKDWESTSFEVLQNGMYARGVDVRRERHCPNCHSVVYSRRHKHCGICARLLPEACLFTEHETANVTLLLQEERERHRQWLGRLGH